MALPILIIAAEAADRNGLPFHQNLGWLVLSFAVAYATYRLVENPVRHARRLARSSWLPVALGVVLIGVSLLVATVALALHPTPASGASSGSFPLTTPKELHRLIEAAPRITDLPDDLRPSLAGVRTDWGGPAPPCWPTFAQPSVPACTSGYPGAPHTVVLYGDSHAAMWYDVISLIAALSHWRLVILAKGDCPVIDLPFRSPPDSVRREARSPPASSGTPSPSSGSARSTPIS